MSVVYQIKYLSWIFFCGHVVKKLKNLCFCFGKKYKIDEKLWLIMQAGMNNYIYMLILAVDSE